jgi:hypothetical protein
MSIMGSHNQAPVSDEVELDGEESEESLTASGTDSNSPNTHSAATVKLDSPPATESDSPNSHSTPTAILRPPQTRD